jgi:hypothetical protein
MIERKLYGHASLCFEKSGDKELQLKCEAYQLATEATNILEENKPEAIRMFQEAAHKFVSLFKKYQSDTRNEAAHCYFSASQYEKVPQPYFDITYR